MLRPTQEIQSEREGDRQREEEEEAPLMEGRGGEKKTRKEARSKSL